MSQEFSRRHFGRFAGMIGGSAAAIPFFNEFAMAQEAERRMGRPRAGYGPDYVRISSNENPMGPCKEGLEALHKVAAHGWRYSPGGEQEEFVKAIASVEGVGQDSVAAFGGSSDPLFRVACAFTSPTRSWVMANPGYGGGAPAVCRACSTARG